MIKVLVHSILILVIFCTLACSNQDTFIEDIRNNNEKYDIIVKTISQSDFTRFSDGQIIGEEYFPPDLKTAINKTKLKGKVDGLVFSRKRYCKNLSFGFYIPTNSIIHSYTISFDPCLDSNRINKDEYYGIWFIDNWIIEEHPR